ncbi:MAG: DUF6272 family protein, partial [Bacteroidales bacterium]
LLGYLMDFYINSGEQDLALAYEGRINKRLMDAFEEILHNQLMRHKQHSILPAISNTLLANSYQEHNNIESDEVKAMNLQNVILVTHNSDSVQYAYGKLIENKNIIDLRQSMDKINSLKGQDLEKLMTADKNDSEGNERQMNIAGFVDVKKSTGEDLESHFLPFNKSHSWFIVISRISKN